MTISVGYSNGGPSVIAVDNEPNAVLEIIGDDRTKLTIEIGRVLALLKPSPPRAEHVEDGVWPIASRGFDYTEVGTHA